MARVLGGVLAAVLSLSPTFTLEAAELQVFCPGAVRAVVTGLAQSFEAETGHRVRFLFGTAGAVLGRAAAGEPGDVILATAAGLADLEQKGLLAAGSRSDLGSVGVGIAVKAGAPPPDIATPEALRRTLLAARSLSYADPAKGGQSGVHFAKVLERLGIAEAVKGQARLFPAGTTGLQKVAQGEIELGIGQMSEIAEIPGVQAVGPLPGSLQNRLTFAAGVLARAAAPEAARAFVAFLTTPAARTAFRNGGFETP